MAKKKGKFLLINLFERSSVFDGTPKISEGLEILKYSLESAGHDVDIWAGSMEVPPIGSVRFKKTTLKKAIDAGDLDSLLNFIKRRGAWLYKDGKLIDWVRIATVGRRIDHKPILRDTGLSKIFESNERLPNFSKYDAIGMSVNSGLSKKEFFMRWLSYVREELPEKPIIAGGAVLWSRARRVLEDFDIDIAVGGLGEIPLLHIFNAILKNKIRHPVKKDQVKYLLKEGTDGIYVKDSRGNIYGKGISRKGSSKAIYHKRGYRDVLEISTTEGCPWKCKFCWFSHNVPLKYRNLDKILEVIKDAKPLELDLHDGCFISSHPKIRKRAVYFLKEGSL